MRRRWNGAITRVLRAKRAELGKDRRAVPIVARRRGDCNAPATVSAGDVPSDLSAGHAARRATTSASARHRPMGPILEIVVQAPAVAETLVDSD
uniref:Uncharacterized protein n=1 Tax=Schlesneria paludicola TaxID=360056 RepID=A0A7C4QNJ7_9PLAN